MNGRHFISCALLALATIVFVGCDKQDDVQQKVKQAGDAAAQKASDVAAAVTEEAQKYLDQVTQFVKDNKLNEAGQVMAKLEALKDKLPAEWAAKIDSARQMLEKAKAAVGGAVGGAAPAGTPR
jgi:hypothetical protein